MKTPLSVKRRGKYSKIYQVQRLTKKIKRLEGKEEENEDIVLWFTPKILHHQHKNIIIRRLEFRNGKIDVFFANCNLRYSKKYRVLNHKKKLI